MRYEIAQEPVVMYHCHCGICRAASGAAFATNILVRRQAMNVTQGLGQLSAFESSPGKFRYFCGCCGSPVYSSGPPHEFISVRAGTLHDAQSIRPSAHCFVASRAPWDLITDDLPRFDAHAPR
ncbi:MAG: GFA family protein [Pseudomonadota bacterium]